VPLTDLTPERFDQSTFRSGYLWGAKSIAIYAGVEPEYVRRVLAKLPDSPIRKFAGRLMVAKTDLDAFLIGKTNSVQPSENDRRF